jgi:type I restriction enzyme M protein
MRAAQDGGSRFGIVLNGSPLFTGGAGGGESEIRRYVLENDLVEVIIGLPTDMFYNTGISTYVWIVSNRKPAHRKGKVQLIDASLFWRKMRKSLGSKRKEVSDEHIATVTRLFGGFVEARLATVFDVEGKSNESQVVITGERAPDPPAEGKVKLAPLSRIFPNEAFGYRTITVERPLRDDKGEMVLGTTGKQKGKPQPDASLRDTEMCHSPKRWMVISVERYCSMRPMRGSTKRRLRSDTKFRSTAISMCSSHRARSSRLMLISCWSRAKHELCT